MTPDHKSIVAKSNDLIGHKTAHFSLSEMRLFAFCLAHYDSRSADDRGTITARVEDLASLFPMDDESAYRVVKSCVLGISKKPLEVHNDKGERELWNWFSGFIYSSKNGEFRFKLNPDIKPYLLELKGNFTKYRLGDIYQFRSATTWKMYEVLKKWAVKGEWEVATDDLRHMIGIAGKYPRWNSFKQWVIDPSLSEINKQSDIKVSYNPLKRGRSIIGLEFRIEEKKRTDEGVIDIEPPSQKLYKALLASGLNTKTAKNLMAKATAYDKIGHLLARLPGMVENAAKRGANQAKYVTGAINDELSQLPLFEDEPPKPDHAESLECWKAKRTAGERCPVRERGAGHRKKCKICLEKIPTADFGV